MSKPYVAMLHPLSSLFRQVVQRSGTVRILSVTTLIAASLFAVAGVADIAADFVAEPPSPWGAAGFVGGLSLLFNGGALAAIGLFLDRKENPQGRSERVEPDAQGLGESVQRNEERYRMLVHAMTTFSGVGDVSGGISTFQEGWHEYTGQTWEEQQGFGWANAIHPEDRQRILHLWQETVQSCCSTRVEYRLWHEASRRYRFCESTAVPLWNSDGTLREWFAAVRDIDDQVRHIARFLPDEASSQRSAEIFPGSSDIVFTDRYGSSVGGDSVQVASSANGANTQ